jgi:signal transduction histidine kinase
MFLSARALGFAASALAFVAIMSVAAFLYFEARVDAILTARQAVVVDSEIRFLELLDREEGRQALARAIARRILLTNDDFAIHALVGADGNYIAGDVDWPDGMVADGKWRPIESNARKQGGQINGFGRALKLHDGAQVLVGRDHTAQHSVQSALREALLTALGVLFLVAGALGYFLNRQVLSRIDTIAATAGRIIAGDIHERIPVRDQANEFDHLSGVLNAMLDANETHIGQMRLVTDAIAHDLRLPLQRVKADLERAALSDDKSVREQAFARANVEMDDALSTFNALLDITRAETGIGREDFEDVDLAELARDVVELFEPVAEDKGQTLTVELQPAKIHGQGALLRQALGNLIQNAIKYAPEGAAIRVRLERAGDRTHLIVEDSGPGIPAEEQETALRPFGRLSRDSATDGKGLGLALVAACAKLHKGKLVLETATPGLRAIVDLPAD